MSIVDVVHDGDIAVVTIDNPPVNAMSHAVRAALKDAIERLGTDDSVRAVVLACAGRTFAAGADIREFGRPMAAPLLYEVCAVIEASLKPVIAAVHGTALGGGFELTLASHGRVFARDAKAGLPEVKIGQVPGAGGTQRLPRLIGVEKTIDIVASGRMIDTEELHTLGVADVLADDVVATAKTMAHRLAGKTPTRVADRTVTAFDRAAVLRQIADVDKRARGQQSPGEAARLVLAAPLLAVADGVKLEREASMRLASSAQGAALRHVFFAKREAAKIEGMTGVTPCPVAIVGVIGAGTMGAGITVALLDAGYRTIVAERDVAAAKAGRERIAATYARLAQARRLAQTVMHERLSRLVVVDALEALAPCDLVIEAVFDDLDIKRDLFRALSAIVRDNAILATNTSYLDPDVIAQAATHPQRVVGMHFFAPANVMRLLEVVRCAKSAPDVLASALVVGRKLRKLPIVSGVCPGFIGNRIYAMYRRQCEFMLEEGATPQRIDEAMETFGLPMGPFRVFDMSGLDIAWAQRKRLAQTRNPHERYVTVADSLCEAGHFGQKTGAGWYSYENTQRHEHVLTTALVAQAAQARGLPQQIFRDNDIRIRLIAAMANEGAKILREGIAARASDIDLVFVNGYGWPGWIGGPMFQASRIGAQRILAEIEAMQSRDGPGWEPDAAIVDAAHAGTPLFARD